MIKAIILFLSFIPVHAFSQNNTSDSIPFIFTEYNNILIPALINKTDSAVLLFHLAADDGVSITTKAIEKLKTIEWNGKDSASAWGGKNESKFSNLNKLKIGNSTWDSIFFTESYRSAHYSDGKFGPTLFTNKVFEINFNKNLLITLQTLPAHISDYQKIDLKIKDGMFFISIILEIQNEFISQDFLIHSGYSSFLLLDDMFTKHHNLSEKLELINSETLTDSFGNKLTTKESRIQSIQIGDIKLEGVDVSFFNGALAKQKISVLGMGVLKQFNLVFDVKKKVLYMKLNG